MVYIVTLLIAVVANNQGRVFVLKMSLVSSARRIDIGGKNKIFASLLSICTTLLLLFLLLSFFVESVAVFGLQEIWGLV